ncbi:MAG TPA: DUF481 domain-containing protein [Myxococcaceae bacterium]|nr:DUF481 domain-containing protein [Myxococcaceae bacterium]
MTLQSCLAYALTLVLVGGARAQDVAPPLEEDGSTDQTRLAGQAGGTWSSGNSTSVSLNFQLRVSHRRKNDQLTWNGLVNYARARSQALGAGPDGEVQTYESDSLYYTRLRYDRFFRERNTFFVAALAFRDESSGFRFRYSPYAGYQRTWIATKSFEAWTDLGYRYARESLLLDRRARREGFPTQRSVHGPLAALGLEAKLNETLDFDLVFEAQQALNLSGDFRVFGVASLTNQIGKGFSLGTNFGLRYHHGPIGDRAPLDTQLQLIALLEYTIEPR